VLLESALSMALTSARRQRVDAKGTLREHALFRARKRKSAAES